MNYEPIVDDLTYMVFGKHKEILIRLSPMEIYESDDLHKDVRVSLTELIGSDKLEEPQQTLLNNYQFDVSRLYYEHTCMKSVIGRKREKEMFGFIKYYVTGTALVTFVLGMSLEGAGACISLVLGLSSIPALNHYFNYKCKVADSEMKALDERWDKESNSLKSKVLEDLVKYESAKTLK